MKQKQKLIMFLFSGILILGVLSGCTDTSYEEPKQEPEPTFYNYTKDFSITISNTSGIDLIIESIDVNWCYRYLGSLLFVSDSSGNSKMHSESVDSTLSNNESKQIKFNFTYKSTNMLASDRYNIKINCHYNGSNNLLTYPYIGSISGTTVSKDPTAYSSYSKTNDTSFKSTGSLLLNFVKTDKNEYVLCVSK